MNSNRDMTLLLAEARIVLPALKEELEDTAFLSYLEAKVALGLAWRLMMTLSAQVDTPPTDQV